MKKDVKIAVFFTFFCFSVCSLFANSSMYDVSYNGSAAGSSEYFAILDTCYERFNSVFHFDSEGPGFKYPVSLFSDENEYRNYVAEKTGSARPKSDTVFLRYSAIAKSEVAAIVSPANKNTFIRQLFTQYIYSFISNPPAWLCNGFSLYFEEYENAFESPWLEPAKALYLNENKRIPVQLMLEATKDTYTPDVFLPQTWLFVTFLMQTPYARDSRFLYDGLVAAEKNYSDTDCFIEYYNKWIDNQQFQKDYDEFVKSLHSVKEDLSAGIKAYSNRQNEEAKRLFLRVLQAQANNYTASYYLALTAYTEKNYKEADQWYKRALQDGADPALVNWGLGASAYADRRFEEGRVYLLKAKQLDEATYGKKVDDLIQQMPTNGR